VANITIRNLDEASMERLRRRAARHGRSTEDEAGEILAAALAEGRRSGTNLVESVRRRFAEVGGVDLPLAAREVLRDPPRFKP
jgi:plasmid stability protein